MCFRHSKEVCILSKKKQLYTKICVLCMQAHSFIAIKQITSLAIFYIVISRCLSIAQISSFTLVDHLHFENMILFFLLPLLTICQGQIYAPYQVSFDLSFENEHFNAYFYSKKKIIHLTYMSLDQFSK